MTDSVPDAGPPMAADAPLPDDLAALVQEDADFLRLSSTWYADVRAALERWARELAAARAETAEWKELCVVAEETAKAWGQEKERLRLEGRALAEALRDLKTFIETEWVVCGKGATYPDRKPLYDLTERAAAVLARHAREGT